MSHAPDPCAFDSLLLLASGEILLLIDGDTLTILAANAAASEHLGYASEELIGQAIGEFECALSDMFFWDEMRTKSSTHEVESTKYPWAGPALFTSVLIAVIVFFMWFLRA